MTKDVLTVYGADWCGDCIRTKKQLGRLDVKYRYINLEEHPDEKETAKSISGRSQIPVVVFSDDSFLVEPSDAALRDKLQALGQI